MLFSYSYIKKSFREFLFERTKTCSLSHCRCNSYNSCIFFCQLYKMISHYFRIGRTDGFFYNFACFRVKWSYSMELSRCFLSIFISFSLLCNYVYKDRFIKTFSPVENIYKIGNIMTVYRSEICEPKFFEKYTAFFDNGIFYIVFKTCQSSCYSTAYATAGPDGIFYKLLCTQISLRCSKGSKMSGYAAYIFRNGHTVIIKNNNYFGLGCSNVIQCLICHSTGERSIADYSNHLIIITVYFSCTCHTCRS